MPTSKGMTLLAEPNVNSHTCQHIRKESSQQGGQLQGRESTLETAKAPCIGWDHSLLHSDDGCLLGSCAHLRSSCTLVPFQTREKYQGYSSLMIFRTIQDPCEQGQNTSNTLVDESLGWKKLEGLLSRLLLGTNWIANSPPISIKKP